MPAIEEKKPRSEQKDPIRTSSSITNPSDYSSKKETKKYKSAYKEPSKMKEFAGEVRDLMGEFAEYVMEKVADGIKATAVLSLVAGASYGGYLGYEAIKNLINERNIVKQLSSSEVNKNLYDTVQRLKKSEMAELFKTNDYSTLTDEQKIELLKTVNSALQKEFPDVTVRVEVLYGKSEYLKKQQEWQDYLNSGSTQPYERVFYIYPGETFKDNILGGMNTAIFELMQTYVEEYYRTNIGSMKIGSLGDNLMLSEYHTYDNNYITYIARMKTITYFNLLKPQTVEKYFINLANVMLPIAETVKGYEQNSNTGGNKTLTLSQLIELDYNNRLKAVGVERTEMEETNSIYYQSLKEALETYQNSVKEDNKAKQEKNGAIATLNPRYIDLENGNTTYDLPTDYHKLHRYLDEAQRKIDLLTPEEKQERQSYIADYVMEFYAAKLYFKDIIPGNGEKYVDAFIRKNIVYLTNETLEEYGLLQAKQDYSKTSTSTDQTEHVLFAEELNLN